MPPADASEERMPTLTTTAIIPSILGICANKILYLSFIGMCFSSPATIVLASLMTLCVRGS